MRAKWRLTAAGVAVLGVMGGSTAIASAEETAQQVISRLKSEGYTVTIDKIGTAPLDQCTVISVRNPQTQTRLIRVERFGKNGTKDFDLVPVVVRRTITVSLDCSK